MEIALIGNPNTGKSSLFNLLTGLNQKVGNFPGVTVEKRMGRFQIDHIKYSIVDLPGVYSVYPKSNDELIVYNSLIKDFDNNRTDIILFVLDASNMERNLFLFSQIYDLNLPIICAVNMIDVARKKGLNIDFQELKRLFPGVEFIEINARIGLGKERIYKALSTYKKTEDYAPIIKAYKPCQLDAISEQEEEAKLRYQKIKERLKFFRLSPKNDNLKTNNWDRLLTHKIGGYVIFLLVMFIIFQSIFSFAQIPMEFIDNAFNSFSSYLDKILPEGVLIDLFVNGIIPGIGGVVIFVPQIMFLFMFIKILEDSGYLSRVVFIMDRIMKPLGLNGKSVVPLISSFACAIPGIMATRTISNWKDRIITIFIAPLMSCSARIPVYTLLIALVIPNKKMLGFIDLQGLVMFALYFIGIFSAIIIAYLMNLFIQSKNKSILVFELPGYKMPQFRTLILEVLQKVKVFVFEAGKIILALSVVLWFLASYGPKGRIEKALNDFGKSEEKTSMSNQDIQEREAKLKLENSYIGILGQGIEPVIEPLGYDWKIGISLITSFAAREVFVGSLATIYSSSEDEENRSSLLNKLSKEKNERNEPVFSLASGLSLMIFYVFAMQCMATFSVVKRETQSWKWPFYQLVLYTSLAYCLAALTFFVFS